jgi:hypothetical protein
MARLKPCPFKAMAGEDLLYPPFAKNAKDGAPIFVEDDKNFRCFPFAMLTVKMTRSEGVGVVIALKPTEGFTTSDERPVAGDPV